MKQINLLGPEKIVYGKYGYHNLIHLHVLLYYFTLVSEENMLIKLKRKVTLSDIEVLLSCSLFETYMYGRLVCLEFVVDRCKSCMSLL